MRYSRVAGWVGVALALAASAARAEEAAPPPAATGEPKAPPVIAAASSALSRTGMLPYLYYDVPTPLESVLQYIGGLVGVSINATERARGKVMVICTLREPIHWRSALDYLASQYKLQIDYGRLNTDAVVTVDKPPLVDIRFDDAQIGSVINSLAKWGGANIVIGPGITGKVTMQVEGVPWRTALDIALKTNGLVLVEEKNGVLRVARPADIEKEMTIRVFRLRYISPKSDDYDPTITSEFLRKVAADDKAKAPETLISVLDGVKSKEGKIVYYAPNNTLVAMDTPTKLEEISGIIRELDIPPKQVHVALRVINMTDNDTENLGIFWADGLSSSISGVAGDTLFPFLNGHDKVPGTSLTNAISGNPIGEMMVSAASVNVLDNLGKTATGNILMPLNSNNLLLTTAPGDGLKLGRLSFAQLSATLQLLRTQSSAKITQAPQIITLDNKAATIHVGENIPYAESFVDTTGTNIVSGFREAKDSPLRTGIQLLVLPRVTGPDNRVLLTLVPKSEDFLKFEEFQGGNLGVLRLPHTEAIVAVTTMLLDNGETGVIAGMRTETRSKSEQKVPFLGDIPVLGWLFKSTTEVRSGKNLLLFVTPTIIDYQRQAETTRQAEMSRAALGQEQFTTIEETQQKR
jgi:type IV pilus assembly protein PilQ